VENYRGNIIEFLLGLQPCARRWGTWLFFIIVKCQALFKQSCESLRHMLWVCVCVCVCVCWWAFYLLCSVTMAIDTVPLLGPQTSYFYTGDKKVHCGARLHSPHSPPLRAERFLFFFARKNGISHVKVVCGGLDTGVYTAQMYRFELVISTCSWAPPQLILDDSLWIFFFFFWLNV